MEINKMELGIKETARRRKFWNTARKDALIGWLFLAPEMIGMLALSVFPIVFSLNFHGANVLFESIQKRCRCQP